MKKNGLKAIACAALAAVITPLAAWAVGDEGDICSIQAVPVDLYKASGNAMSPHWIGDTVYIRIRLLNENWQECRNPGTGWITTDPLHEWVLERNGTSLPADWKEVVYRPALRIAIGSKIVSATLGEGPNFETSGANPDIGIYTDLYFSYTVKEGELGLPIRLVNANGEIVDGTSAIGVEGLSLLNVRTAGNPVGYWDLTNDILKPGESAHLANFKFGPVLSSKGPSPMNNPGYPEYDPRYEWTWPQYSINVVWPGIYVQSIDFDTHEGNWEVSTDGPNTAKKKPAVAGIGPATVYLWSSDESVMVPQGDVTTVDDGGGKTRQVLTLKLGTSETTAFGMKATDTASVGSLAWICLCSQPSPAKNAQGDILAGSFVSNLVEVVAPPPPSVRLSWEKSGEGGVYPEIVAAYTNDLSEVAERGYPIDVTLSEAFGQSVKMIVRAKVSSDTTDDWQYVYTNALVGTAVTDAGDVPDSFVTPPNATEVVFGEKEISKRIWVYPVGSHSKFSSKGDTIDFKLEFAPETPTTVTEKFTNTGSCTLRIVDPKPAVLAPTASDAYAVGDPITVTIADSYRDRTDPRTMKVQVLNGTTELYASNIVFTAKGKTPSDTVDIEMDKASVLEKLQRDDPRTVQITVKVTDPLSQFASSSAFDLSVPGKEKAKTISAVLYDSTSEDSRHAGSEFAEGETPCVRFVLSERLEVGSDLYAFLVPQSEASSNLVESTLFKEGVLIAGGSTNSVLNLKYRLSLLDGCDLTDGTTSQLKYKIVLRTSADPTKGNVDTTFTDTEGLQLTVANVNTASDSLYINGSPEPTPNGGKFETTLASGSDQTFVASYSEVSENDLTNGIVTVWCFTDGRTASTYKYSAVTSKTDTVSCKHEFNYAGGSDQKVMFIPVDKDLLKTLTGGKELQESSLKTLWPSLLKVVSPYTVTVHIGEAKHVVVEPEVLQIYENDSGTKVRFAISDPYDEASLFLAVKVTSLNETVTELQQGCAKFAESVLEIKKGSTEPAKTTTYQGGLKFVYADLDGTVASAVDGFYIEAQVFESKADAQAWLADPSSEEGLVKAYEKGTAYLYVQNVPPTISPAPTTTNKTIALDQEFEIKDWWAKDIKKDLAEGLTCKWYIDDALQADKTTVVNDSKSHTVSGLKFTSEGAHEVRLEVTDKDGADADGQANRIWYYYIAPTKRLEVTPFGPASISSMVSKYGTADGLGKGRVWAGAASTVVSEFTSTFNVNVNVNELMVYAYGYKAAENEGGYDDDGNLKDSDEQTGKDTAITSAGASTESGPYFKYGVDRKSVKNEWKYDNYFYCWMNRSSESCLTDLVNGIPKPATAPTIATKVTATLDPYEGKKETYSKREMEAVFAREWMPSDNCGDINGDGVPDLFMLKTWKGGKLLELVYGDAVGNVADLKDLAQTNPDEDYLPGVLLKEGELGLVANAQRSYAPIGRPFTTLDELRGLETGLNAQDLVKSDACFSPAETNAWVAWLQAQGETVDPKNPPPGDLTRWSPEPSSATFARMDPTMADTDGDGFDDGWEYYFWYAAHVLYPAGELKAVDGQTAAFERFDPVSFVYGTPLTNATDLAAIEKRFNPCEKRELKPSYCPAEDFDNDGLSDYEEYLLGTNPCHWDTDGDHMCDAWEVMACLSPLDKGDKGANEDHDFMAYVKTWGMYGYYDEVNELWYFDIYGKVLVDEDGVVLRDCTCKALVVRPMWTDDGKTNLVLYGRADDVKQPTSNPMFYTFGELDEKLIKALDATIWGYAFSENPNFAAGERWIVDYTFAKGDKLNPYTKFVMMHDQIRDMFGFDPRTAWNKNGNGYVDKRWEETPGDSTGVAMHTYPFTAYDEYLGGVYRAAFIPAYPGEKLVEDPTKDPFGYIRSKTTNPSIATAELTEEGVTNGVPYIIVSTNTSAAAAIADAAAAAFAKSGGKHTVFTMHGADTDGDGAPDGWELYVKRNPSQAAGDEENPQVIYTRELLDGDIDDDGLLYAMEYAGTDSCNAYSDCPSIYKNHPGNASGWFNKFFPTDPDNGDTDGDSIADSREGKSWLVNHTDDFGDGGVEALSFVYGKPEDDGSQCIRGGGLNPLTADTDLDGLPDPWERQYAGLPFDLAAKEYWNPGKPDYETGEVTIRTDPAIAESRLIAAGILNQEYTAGVIIIDGMDGTWGGDAYTDPYDAPKKNSASYDPLTDTIRDVDFDQDGLQNWQEYLVQTVRHFRYDDISMPLMGRQFTEGERDPMTGLLIGEHTQPFIDFVQMKQTPGALIQAAGSEWNTKGGTMFSLPWTTATYRDLGYMAPVQQAFDRMACHPKTMDNPYILMPAAGAYVSTDPRNKDTDGDGMDDYYEMFHGLNPLLGSTSDTDMDVIAQAYGVPEYFNAFWNEWTHPDFDRILPFSMPPQPGSKKRVAPIEAPMALDPVLYPWAIGTYEADPDGDGIRNDEERILPNVTSPTPSHTDPTPLWMTERSMPKSYTWQYYTNSYPVTAMPFYPSPLGYHITEEPYYNKSLIEYDRFSPPPYLYSYEMNDGYDTDNDWNSDGVEITKTVRSATSPLVYSDPDRRQAVYFPGKDAYVMTRDLQERGVDAPDMLKQFTVECWIRPEASGTDQTIIERSTYYGGNAVTKLGGVIRANFRIGMSADGRIYGMFDNNDAIESGLNQPKSCQRVDGPKLTLSKWSHVALTYDGHDLVLYVNGMAVTTAAGLGLIPANGVESVQQEATDPARFPGYQYKSTPLALFIGARPQHLNAVADRVIPLYTSYVRDGKHWESFLNMREYYNGYVDEVRIWDGARTAAEISANYKKRMSFEDVAENRKDVYNAWKPNGAATRNDNDGLPTLPAELVQHYNFVTLPGAVKASDVAQTPSGFVPAVDEQAQSSYKVAKYPDIDLKGLTNPKGLKSKDETSYAIEDGLNVDWWNDCLIRSTVYGDTRVIPWIENAVGHLPAFEGGSIDSRYMSETMAGTYTSVTNHEGLAKFAYPNEAIPYQDVYTMLERYVKLFQVKRLVEECGEYYEDLQSKYRYEVRSRFPGTSDLLPLGGAYAKTCPEMWDDGSAADAWEQTGSDDTGVGIPKWWTDYARENYCPELPTTTKLTWETEIDYHGMKLAAYQAYLIDLARGMQPNGKIDSAYAATADSDGDKIPDWWERLWGVEKYGADDDPDHDGLSNYAEYLLSFGANPYGTANGFPLLNPTQSRSGADQLVVDYFLPGPTEVDSIPGNVTTDASGKIRRHFNSHEYLGEIATDHDFMETWWEKQYNNTYVNSGVYDPQLDADVDGWSNFAECRAALWGGFFNASLIDSWTGLDSSQHVACYPEPIIGVKPVYFGDQKVGGCQLVIRVTSGQSSRTDATFVVPSSLDSQVRYLGAYRGNGEFHGHLSPGHVNVNSIVFERAVVSSDKMYTWNCDWYRTNAAKESGWSEYGLTSGLTWEEVSRTHIGTFENYKTEYARWPKIELEGGDLQWESFATASELTPNVGTIIFNGNKMGSVNVTTGEFVLDMNQLGADVDMYVFRVTYTSRIGYEWPQTVYVSDTKELASGTGTSGIGAGRVREGRNTVEVFMDLDGSGTWTPGEPYGMVKNVEIGWHKVPVVAVELKDEGVVLSRTELSGSGTDNVIVRRVSINGQEKVNGKTVPQRQLVTRTIVLDDRPYLTEADVLGTDIFDLDWKWLTRDATEKLGLEMSGIRTAGYSVERVIRNADGTTTTTNVASFTKSFNAQRSKPVVKSPTQGKPVYAARPTFAFTSSDETMTACQIQVLSSTNTADLVWDSGVMTLPARSGLDVGVYAYSVTPALYADCMISTNGSSVFFDGSNYYWRVALLNAKFKDTADVACWSDLGSFQMDVGNKNRYPDFTTGYGSVATAVRYFGPAKVPEGSIVVEAFENADFTGSPVARQRVTDVSRIDSITDVTTTNALLRGIEPGTVYLRAYIDQNDNNKRDSWESWGYLNAVGKSVDLIYTPESVEIVDSLVQIPTCTIYIEDCDTNGNEIPDGLEPDSFVGGNDSTGAQDGDKDGISDDDENALGTDPTLWDTDGDGMPDGWEVLYADLDPRFYDAEEATDGDVMAYAEVAATLVTVQNTDKDGDTTVYVLDGEETSPRCGDSAIGLKLYSTYAYQVSVDGVLQVRYGRGKAVALKEEAGKLNRVTQVAKGTIVLVHAQVYGEFGFNSLTANAAAFAASNSVNTKAFTALDKYLLLRYFAAYGITNEVQNAAMWKNWTLKPSDVDNDKDGISDGWELYVMFGKSGLTYATAGYLADGTSKFHSPWNSKDRSWDLDGDELDLLREYDDGNLPTDPWCLDTDHDGISDAHAYAFHLKGERYRDDDDNDGLSNFQEYLSSVALTNAVGTLKVDAAKMLTYEKGGQVVPDYFLRVGSLYLGEILGDHDFIEDWLEDDERLFNEDRQASRYKYDAHLDTDDNGWDNWSEARAFLASPTNRVLVSVTTNIIEETGAVASIDEVYEDVVDYRGRPMPEGRIRIVYNGKQQNFAGAPIVVQTYRYRDGKCPAMDYPADGTWTFPMTGRNDWYALATPTNGYICGGKNLAVVWAETITADGVWTPGEPYGLVPAMEAGYSKIADSEVELTDVNPSIMRLDLASAIANNEYETQRTLNDRGVNADGAGQMQNGTAVCNVFSNVLEQSSYVRVRVVRLSVNDKTSMTYSYYREESYYALDTLLDTYMDMTRTPFLTENALLRAGLYDIDWGNVKTVGENLGLGARGATVGKVTYGVVVGDGEIDNAEPSAKLNLLATSFTNAFEPGDEPTPATPVAAAFAQNDNRPTFSWKHEQKIKDYPAFRLRIWKGDKVVYDSGAQRAPIRSSEGVYRWTAPAYVGVQLENNTDYKFSVTMLDAKFTSPNKTETKCSFRTDVNGVGGDLSDQYSVFVAVKYFGPIEVNTTNILVQAFESPDFVGAPKSIATVKNVDTMAATNIVTWNAQLIGLAAGRPYYVRAFIDSNTNGVKDVDESWGYGNFVGSDRKDLYTPRAYVADKGSFQMPEAVVYIEDVDRDNNGFPDGHSGNAGVTVAPSPYVVTYDGEKTASTNVFAAIEGDAALLPFVSQLNSFSNGQKLSAYQTSFAMMLDGIDPADIKTEPVAKITNFSLDGIKIAVETPTTVNGETLQTKRVKVSVKLEVTVWYVSDLGGEWQTLGTPIEKMVEVNTVDGKISDDVMKDVNTEISKITATMPSAFLKVEAKVVR